MKAHLVGIGCLLVLAGLGACASLASHSGTWAVEGTWTDACCCKLPCPCLFGSGASEGFCEGASVIEIERGHHGGVPLDGLAAVVTYRVGGWTKVSVSEGASAVQVEAVGAVLPHLLPFVERGSEPEVRAAPVEVDHRADAIRYAAPGTTVELELMPTASGEPIVLQNLPAAGTPFPRSHDHVQYRSRLVRHVADEGGFEWSGRNGFRSRLDLSGTIRVAAVGHLRPRHRARGPRRRRVRAGAISSLSPPPDPAESL